MKSEEITRFLDGFAKETFGMSRSEAIRNGVCVSCQDMVISFNDDISEREFKISGLCQKCQDEAFGLGDE